METILVLMRTTVKKKSSYENYCQEEKFL